MMEMEKFTIDPSLDGKGLVRAILARFPDLPASRVFQALRRKDVRVNGVRQHDDIPVHAGDEVTLFLAHPAARPSAAAYDLVHADSQILIVNKRPGIAVEPVRGTRSTVPDLLAQIRADFADPAIELGHRIDRQTGGLLILTRTLAAQAAIRDLLVAGKIVKRYRCLVRGSPDAGRPVVCHDRVKMREMAAWLEKDAGKSEVFIHDVQKSGDVPVITRYRILAVYRQAGPGREDVSLLEVELVTGRTHQIRAHFAHAGHPLLGDGKYGRNEYNRFFRGLAGPLTRQQLFACQLDFLSPVPDPLAHLAGRTFSVEARFDWQAPTR
jgi:23S rRNA pseudouridine955/2504/2580 synthase